MKTEITEKELYVAPEVEIIETVSEGILCASDQEVEQSSVTGVSFTSGATFGSDREW